MVRMKEIGRYSLLVLLIGLISGGSVAAEKRVALVIGNGGYEFMRPLSHPRRDAEAMPQILKKLGFDPVLTVTDVATLPAMRDQIHRFIEAGKDADVRLFYYSGHGANYYGKESYLLPVQAKVRRADELPDVGYGLQSLLRALKLLGETRAQQNPAVGSGVNIVLLDACRDEPFGEESKGIGDEYKGIGRVEKAAGTLVAYAAGAGEQAIGRGGEQHSLFTKHLLKYLQEPIEINQVLTRVRAAVARENGRQWPEALSGLTEDLYLVKPPVVTVEPPPVTTGTLVIKDSQPPGVVIYVDGARLGAAPQRLEGLSAGKAVTVTARQSGYEDYQERVWIRGGQVSELNVVLQRKEPAAPPAASAPPTPSAARPRPAFEPQMVQIPAGCFEMGSPASEADRYYSRERQHRVCVDRFEMGKYEVTQGEWQAVMGSNPSNFKSGDRHPVETVSWHKVQDYIRKLNERTGQQYRLATEAEWEYACRGGKAGERYCGGNDVDRVAWHKGNSGGKTHPVGEKAANGFGLYDMSGNVREWTCSFYFEEYNNAEKECKFTDSKVSIAVRNGDWDFSPAWVRSAHRDWFVSVNANEFIGFRLAR